MKISISECNKAASGTGESARAQEKILPKDMPSRKSKGKPAAHLTPLEQGILTAEEALKQIPDTRDELVEELRSRIESGEYNVSGEDVADMMMRRRAADRIR
ncbi:MAG: flagellar biosynthesis anti-sigma factor FlgM [Armatimonadetes bacterium]|nr:flagellar biosynthesis anti-sigma factor FlgM [Armatimonadota bacterium]